MISDLKMGVRSGIDLLRAWTSRRPETPFIIVTAYGDVESAVEAMKLGACDFMTKPIDPTKLLEMVKRCLETPSAANSAPAAGVQPVVGVDVRLDVERMVGVSASIRRVRDQIRRVAPSDSTVLLLGESGLFSFYWLIVRERHRVDKRKWKRGYAHIIRMIDPDVVERGIELKVFQHRQVSDARARARAEPHPFWATPDALEAMRGFSTFAVPGQSLRCDFVIPEERLIVEYDERQHFTVQRAKALELYPSELKLAFDRHEWIDACNSIRATDPVPPHRDEQRAFYDSLRDVLAVQNGYRIVRFRQGVTDCTGSDASTAWAAAVMPAKSLSTTGMSAVGDDIKKIGLVTHDCYNVPDSRGLFDYSEHLDRINKLCDDQGCDTILYALWTWDSSSAASRTHGSIFPEGNLELILDLSFDVDGNLWVVANLSGLYKINLNNEIVEHYELGAGFLRIQKDHKGIIWLAILNRGIFFLNSDLTSIHQLLLPIEKIQRVVTYGVFEDTHNNLWIGYANKLAIINSERNSIRLIGTEDGLEINVPYEFTEDSTGKVWISAFARGAKSISLAERKIYTLGSKQGFFGSSRDVVLDPQQRNWIIYNDTVYLYNQASNELKKFPTGAAVRTTGHPAKSIADLNGLIWIGTVNTGLLLVDSRGTFSEHFNTANGLASNDVWGIVEDKNKRVWLATYRGINIYDPAVEKLYLMKFPDNLSRNDHRTLDLLDEDHILIGSVGGYSIIDLKRNTITFYKSGPSTAQFFWAGITDREGNLWISSASGIMKFNSDRTVMWKANESSGLISNTVWVMVPDLQGKIWLVTDKGVNVIDPKSKYNPCSRPEKWLDQ